MDIVINSQRENQDDITAFVTISYGGEDYKWHIDIPKDVDAQSYLDSKKDKWECGLLLKQYKGSGCSTPEEWKEFIDGGCIIPEITKEVSHPEIEAKDAVYKQDILVEGVEAQDAVYETRIVTAGVEAKDAVMGSRQKETVTEVEEEVSSTKIVEEDGKYIQKVTTETVTRENKELQFEEVSLYNEDGDEIGKHKIPVMEEYEISPAVEAVAEVTEEVLVSEAIEEVEEELGEKYLVSEAVEYVDSWEETIIVRPEEVIKKQPWVNTH
tara:strand:- start:251 stop:1054 length:804 start_codon:yes stop_codon:yes gene_type:complete